jgi:GC-rich sequence DNA-binding factor
LGLEDWQEAHEMTKNSLFRTNESLSSSLAAVASSLERSLAGANEKYLYMQELCDYVSVLCEFLQVRHFVLSGIFQGSLFGGSYES